MIKREIRYRGYDADNNTWRYGYYFHKTDTILCAASDEDRRKNSHHFILFGGFCDWNMPRPYFQNEIEEDSIGMYTGKHDMHGAEVYEGDIIQNRDGTRMEIRYGLYNAHCPVDECSMDSVGFYAVGKGLPEMPVGCLEDYVVVIGNTWENPDLLSVKD